MTNTEFPAYFTDTDCVNQLHKSKSGYYVRDKAWRDYEKGVIEPPTKQGYYNVEYRNQMQYALAGLPF